MRTVVSLKHQHSSMKKGQQLVFVCADCLVCCGFFDLWGWVFLMGGLFVFESSQKLQSTLISSIISFPR